MSENRDEQLLKVVLEPNVVAARDLIAAGANVNARFGIVLGPGGIEHVVRNDRSGSTMLHILLNRAFIADADAVSMVELLFRSGAEINPQDATGRTPIMCAALNKHPQVVKLLLEKQADTQLVDSSGNTVFTLTLSQNDYRYHGVLSLLAHQTEDGRVWLESQAGRRWAEATGA